MTHDVTPPDSASDWLDRLLVADGAATRDEYIGDDGFTAKVIAALPVPIALQPSWRRPAIVALWGVAAAALAVAMPGAIVDVGREAYRLLATQPVSLSGIAGAVVAMLVLTGAGAAYTLRQND